MTVLIGRYTKQDVVDPKSGELIIASDEFITEDIAKRIVDCGIEGLYIRSAFTCKSVHGRMSEVLWPQHGNW